MLYRNLTSFFLTHKCGLVPYFKERLETLTQKTGKFIGTAPQTILIPKGGIFLTTQDNSIVLRQTWWRKPILTWWQELQEKFVTSLTWLQEPQKRFVIIPTRWHTTQEEIPYCSPTTSSGKKKKARSTSQPQFRSENTPPPPTIEPNQVLLAPEQLATNSNSGNFNNNISRISKLPKSLTTTMPTFDGKS